MKEFKAFFENGFPDYDAPYVNEQQFVMLIKGKDKINYSFANVDFHYLAGYPNNKNDYSEPDKLLKDELKYYNSTKGAIFENINGNFQEIAFIDLNAKEGISR